MAAFDLSQYATVEERIRELYQKYPDARIITDDLTTLQDRQVSTWRVKATIYLNADEQSDNLPKATGHAFEVDGQGMANKTSAWENAETSAIGRALANMAMSGSKRASKTEMAKVASGVTPKPTQRDWVAEAEAKALVYDLDGVRALYSEMARLGAPADLIEKVKTIGNELKG